MHLSSQLARGGKQHKTNLHQDKPITDSRILPCDKIPILKAQDRWFEIQSGQNVIKRAPWMAHKQGELHADNSQKPLHVHLKSEAETVRNSSKNTVWFIKIQRPAREM